MPEIPARPLREIACVGVFRNGRFNLVRLKQHLATVNNPHHSGFVNFAAGVYREIARMIAAAVLDGDESEAHMNAVSAIHQARSRLLCRDVARL